jgi:hypothetical protein
VKKQTPPPKLEPKLEPPDMAAQTQRIEPAPVFKLAPEPDLPGRPRPAANVTGTPPRHGKAAYAKWVLWYAAAGCLLAVVLAAAIGVDRIWPWHQKPAPATAATTAPAATTATAAPLARPAAVAEPSPAVPDTKASSADTANAQVRDTPVIAPETSAKPSATASRNTQRKTRPVPPPRVDNCKNPDVSERSASCLFQ